MELVMKLYYMNDEKSSVVIQVNGQLRPSEFNPHGEPSIEFFTLQPGEARTFFIDAPEDSIPYVKRWENRLVLLSYVDLEFAERDRSES